MNDGELVAPVPDRALAAFRDVVADNLNANLARSDAFERRATTLLGVVTAALTILLAAAGLGDEVVAPTWVALPVLLGVCCLVAAAVFAVRTMRPTNVRVVDPDSIAKLWHEQMKRPSFEGVQVYGQVLAHLIDPTPGEDGESVSVLTGAHWEAEWRARQLAWAGRCLVAGLVFMGAAVVSTVAGRMWL